MDQRGRALHTRWLTLAAARIPELGLHFAPTLDAAYFYDGGSSLLISVTPRRHGEG